MVCQWFFGVNVSVVRLLIVLVGVVVGGCLLLTVVADVSLTFLTSCQVALVAIGIAGGVFMLVIPEGAGLVKGSWRVFFFGFRVLEGARG